MVRRIGALAIIAQDCFWSVPLTVIGKRWEPQALERSGNIVGLDAREQQPPRPGSTSCSPSWVKENGKWGHPSRGTTWDKSDGGKSVPRGCGCRRATENLAAFRVRPVRGQEQQSTVSIFSTITSTTNAIKPPNPSPSIHPGYKNGSRAPALTDSSSDARPGTLVRGRCRLGAGRKLRTGPVCNPEWRGGSPPACRASQLMHRSVPWRRVSIWRHAELGGA